MTTVSSGQTSAVSSGQADSGWIVLSSGTLDVLSGGITIDTTISGGALNISSGGITISTTESGNFGSIDVSQGGFAIDTTVYWGLDVSGTASATWVLSGQD